MNTWNVSRESDGTRARVFVTEMIQQKAQPSNLHSPNSVQAHLRYLLS